MRKVLAHASHLDGDFSGASVNRISASNVAPLPVERRKYSSSSDVGWPKWRVSVHAT